MTGTDRPCDALEEYRLAIPGDADGAHLYVRRRRPPSGAPTRPPVLMVHGSTYPGHTVFDLDLDGVSWMSHLAARGHDVCAVDLRGYGLSDRGPALDAPPAANPPQTRTETAVADLGAVLDWMAATVAPDPPVLIGWSWGTTLCAALTARRPVGAVEQLVLVGPQWMRAAIPPALAVGHPLGAYRRVTVQGALARKLQGVPPEHQAALSPPHWLEAWGQALIASDPDAIRHDPPAFRAPNGTLADTLDVWCRGRAPYDPTAIRCPVQIVVGEWDVETPPAMARGLFAALTNSPDKRLMEIGRATHALVLERTRDILFSATDAFLS